MSILTVKAPSIGFDESRIARFLDVLDFSHHGTKTTPDLIGKAAAFAAYASQIANLFIAGFDIKDPAAQDAIRSIIVCYDYFCRAIDAATDEKFNVMESVHSGALALAMGATRASALLGDATQFLTAAERYLAQASEGERHLWKHHNKGACFDETDIWMLGRKNAVMKVAPALCVALTDNWAILPALENVMDHVAVGVQLIDDVLDWEEDYLHGYFSLPLRVADACNAANALEIRQALFVGGAAIDALEIASAEIAKASSILVRNQLAFAFPSLPQAREMVDRMIDFIKRNKSSSAEEIEWGLRSLVPPVLAYQ